MYVSLQRGDRLPTVALLQSRLMEHGADLSVDGMFGQHTEDAVIAFKSERRLSHPKVVDAATWAELNRRHPLCVVDALDAADLSVLRDDGPFLNDGQSRFVASYGMSRGAATLVDRLVAMNTPRSVALLRFHGHGSPGRMVVTGGRHSYGDASFTSSHFQNPRAVEDFARLGTIMKTYGSIELHGCRVGLRAEGRTLLQSMAYACGVPVSAGLKYQTGGHTASRLEGPVLTKFSADTNLKAWSHRVFTACEW